VGPLRLAMVLRYWKSKDAAGLPMNARIQQTFNDCCTRRNRAAFLRRTWKSILRDSGFETFAFRGEWSDLRSQIAKGRPLIAGCLKAKGAPAHYVVIVGVEAEDVAVLLNDPERGKLLRVERNEFAKVWKGTENWTLLAVPRHPE